MDLTDLTILLKGEDKLQQSPKRALKKQWLTEKGKLMDFDSVPMDDLREKDYLYLENEALLTTHLAEELSYNASKFFNDTPDEDFAVYMNTNVLAAHAGLKAFKEIIKEVQEEPSKMTPSNMIPFPQRG